ncbi:MAG: 4-(cytidine 5'-diphospho)-2-C-methyl-D-erythritol kinase [Planktomarina sp.]
MPTNPGFAPAKINLTLHVTGQRDDGYHLLDSLVVFADIGDQVSAMQGSGLTLNVSGPNADGIPTDGSNLVIKAAQLLGVDGAALTLEKHLPAAAGIGGGSSDAAATLRLFSSMWNIPLPSALSLGADVPVCLSPTCQRMSGIGEVIVKGPAMPAIPAVLVNPGVHVPTSEIFAALITKDNAPMQDQLPDCATVSDVVAFLETCRNDLVHPAIKTAPTIADVLGAIQSSGAEYSQMSGSGATCFGIYDSMFDALDAAEELAEQGWWVQATMLNTKL